MQQSTSNMSIEGDYYGIPFIEFSENQSDIDPDHIEAYKVPYLKYIDHFSNEVIVDEPLLVAANDRYTTYPICNEHFDIWDIYKKQLEAHWVVDEVLLSNDLTDWETALTHDQRKFILYVLAFFASADGIVNANIKQNLIDVVHCKEAECAYGKQFDMENTHGEMYSILIQTYVTNSELRTRLFRAIESIEGVKLKAKWCQKWIDSDYTYAHKLIAFAIVEGIFFSGAFASIFWIKTLARSPMSGLRTANKFIAKDEYMHVQLACIMFSKLKNRLKESIVHQIISEAVEIEKIFINESLPCRLIGMNSELMSQYIEYCADQLLIQLNYNKLYNSTNPFEFMKKIDNYIKQNFFEGRNDVYSAANINNPKVWVIMTEGF